MAHAVIVTHGVADVDYHNHNTIIKLTIFLVRQHILNIQLMWVKQSVHNLLTSLTVTKIEMVIRFVL